VLVGIHTLPQRLVADDIGQAMLRIPRTDHLWTEDTSVDDLTMLIFHIDAASDQQVELVDGTSPPLDRIGVYRLPGAARVHPG